MPVDSVSRSLALVVLVSAGAAASAATFNENFEVDPTASWVVHSGPSDSAANFFFDYSTVGIPAAPNGTGTRGMKLQANLSNGIFSGMSASPLGLNMVGDYSVTFDFWANFNGPLTPGGSGSANLSTFGIGTAGTSAQWPGGTTDSVWFGTVGDGGSASDYRAYSTAAPTSYPSGHAVYAAASNNASDPYFAAFGGVAAPAAQLALFPQQTGSTGVGTSGMAWHEMEIVSAGGFVTWRMDGLLIATVDLSTVTISGGNIFFGHSDINATSSTDPNDADLLFTLIDNIVVVPAPATLPALGLGVLAIRRRR